MKLRIRTQVDWALLCFVLPLVALLAVLSACGGGGDEALTIDGETITRRDFEERKKALAEFIDAYVEEDWGRLHGLLDEESREACPRLEFVTAMGATVGFAKAFLGESWWEEVAAAFREVADVVDAVSWEEFRDDPEVLEARLDEEMVEVFGPTEEEEEGEQEWVVEDGEFRLHWPDACESAFTEEEEEERAPIPSPTTATPAPAPTPTEAPVGGSRENPVPLGQSAVVADVMEVKVIALNPDAWPVIQAENQFNDPPEDGKRMMMVTLEAANVGQEPLDVQFEPSYKLVGSKSVVYEEFDPSCGVIPNPLEGELFPGGRTQGNVCVQPDIDDTNLVLFVEMFTEDFERVRWFFALQ